MIRLVLKFKLWNGKVEIKKEKKKKEYRLYSDYMELEIIRGIWKLF